MSTQRTPPPRGEPAESEPRWFKTAGEAVGFVAGAVAIVYLLGGIVYALRLGFLGFPLETIVGLIGQLPRESVITAGFLEGLANAAVVGGAAAVIYGALDAPKPRQESDDRLNSGPRWKLKLAGLLVVALALDAPAVVYVCVVHGFSWKLVSSFVGLAVTYALVCAGWVALRLLAKERPWHHRFGQAITAGVIWMGMALVPSVMFGAAVEFESARVCLRDPDQSATGDVIAETKDRVLLAIGHGDKQRLLSLPASRVRHIEYGVGRDTMKCPPDRAS